VSFSISIGGHSSNPHNAKVQEAVDAALGVLAEVEGLSCTVTGYSGDSTGSITLAGALPRAEAAQPPVAKDEPDGA